MRSCERECCIVLQRFVAAVPTLAGPNLLNAVFGLNDAWMHSACQLLDDPPVTVKKSSAASAVRRKSEIMLRHTYHFVATVVLVLIQPTELPAQFASPARRPAISASIMTELPITAAGGRIANRLVDPFMTTQQVERAYQFLRQPYQFEWNSATTPRDIHRDLAQQISIEIDFEGLEEIGIDVDKAIHPELSGPRSRRATAVTQDPQDPFSPAYRPVPQVAPAKEKIGEVPEKHRQVRKWWRKEQQELPNKQSISNGARLFYFLERCDLTLNVQLGQLVITTMENAEQYCCIRMYDVTTLVKEQEPSELDSLGYSPSGGGYFEESLVEMIQSKIDPDTWEMLGGPSTISLFTTDSRSLLVVSSPLMTHWKIEALLTELNR